MRTVRFISDLHLGHKSICTFSGKERGGVTTVEEHDRYIIEQWNSVVQKNDLVWVYRDWETDRKSTRLNSSHSAKSRMPSSA